MADDATIADDPTAGDTRSAASALAEFVPRLARVIAVALAAETAVGLTIRQYRILERLTSRPHRTSELASTSEVSQPTASTAIGALEGRRLVGRRRDPEDGRATLVELTTEGREVFEAARACILDRLEVVTRELDASDAEALWDMVPALIAGMDRARQEKPPSI